MEGDLLWRIIIFKIVLCVVVEFVEEELEEGNFCKLIILRMLVCIIYWRIVVIFWIFI